MQFQDAEVVKGGQSNSEYDLGIGARLDVYPHPWVYATYPETLWVAGKHICHFQDHHQNNFPP
jgi:hypothetical protein